MVDVSDKAATERDRGRRRPRRHGAATLDLVLSGDAKKGDVLGAARIAGIMAAKSTHELIPLCHPLPITKVEVDIAPDDGSSRPPGARHRQGHRPDRRRDGGADRGLGRLPHDLRHGQGGRARHAHRGIRLVEKSGGKSGHYRAAGGLSRGAALGRGGARPRARQAEPLPREDVPLVARTAACSPPTSPRCARSRPPMSPPWTAMRCAPPTSRRPAVLKRHRRGRGRPAVRRHVGAGEAARIFTGGVLPRGADTIVIQENTSREGDASSSSGPSAKAATSASPGSTSSRATCC